MGRLLTLFYCILLVYFTWAHHLPALAVNYLHWGSTLVFFYVFLGDSHLCHIVVGLWGGGGNFSTPGYHFRDGVVSLPPFILPSLHRNNMLGASPVLPFGYYKFQNSLTELCNCVLSKAFTSGKGAFEGLSLRHDPGIWRDCQTLQVLLIFLTESGRDLQQTWK